MDEPRVLSASAQDCVIRQLIGTEHDRKQAKQYEAKMDLFTPSPGAFV